MDMSLDENGGWDLEVVNHLFLHIDVQILLSIPMGFAAGEDSLIWHYDAKGDY